MIDKTPAQTAETTDGLGRIAMTEQALQEILRECDEAPTDNNAWVVAIQKIARDALNGIPAQAADIATERLRLADRIEAWSPSNGVLVFIARERRLIADALRALAPPHPPACPYCDVSEFARAILHGDDEHRRWLLEAAAAYEAGKPIPTVRSALQAPAGNAEVMLERIPFDDDADEPKTWRGLAHSILLDMFRYAKDSGPERRLVSAEAYVGDALRLASVTKCGCLACDVDGPHASSCAVHNGTSMDIGPCDCGASALSSTAREAESGRMERLSVEKLARHFGVDIARAQSAQDDIGFMYRASSVSSTHQPAIENADGKGAP